MQQEKIGGDGGQSEPSSLFVSGLLSTWPREYCGKNSDLAHKNAVARWNNNYYANKNLYLYTQNIQGFIFVANKNKMTVNKHIILL